MAIFKLFRTHYHKRYIFNHALLSDSAFYLNGTEMPLSPFIKIIRLQNAIMAGAAVFLGFWLANSPMNVYLFPLLVLAAISSTGFGNIINDIKDIATDKISHPDRPLPRGDISISTAYMYAGLLSATAVLTSFLISVPHGIATAIPLVLLTLYTAFLKSTPLYGNIMVATLVAYPILYGALGAPGFSTLLIPALLAFLLNLSREIIKDLQDEQGDKKVGYITTASLPHLLLKWIIIIISIIYILLIPVPFLKKHFNFTYLGICLSVAVPVHIFRTYLILKPGWHLRLKKISGLLKFEMLIGLLALAADHLVSKLL